MKNTKENCTLARKTSGKTTLIILSPLQSKTCFSSCSWSWMFDLHEDLTREVCFHIHCSKCTSFSVLWFQEAGSTSMICDITNSIQRSNPEKGIHSKIGEVSSSYSVKWHIIFIITHSGFFFIEEEGVDDQNKYFYSLSSMTKSLKPLETPEMVGGVWNFPSAWGRVDNDGIFNFGMNFSFKVLSFTPVLSRSLLSLVYLKNRQYKSFRMNPVSAGQATGVYIKIIMHWPVCELMTQKVKWPTGK